MASLLHRAARKLVRRPLALYDRLLGGRAFPGAAALDRQVARLQTWAGGGDVPLSKDQWDAEYGGGVWDYLAGEEEAARYRAIVALIDGAVPAEGELRSVLDVGCGEGVLADFLASDYTGLDLSERAIETARTRRGGDRTRFLAADAETWEPTNAPERGEHRGQDPVRYDVIVLNECLYYFHEPLATLGRYLEHLADGGALIVSLYEAPRTIALARALDRQCPPLRTERVAGPRGAWRISVHRSSH